MKLFIVGSIKIDSYWRKKVFLQNLSSLEPVSDLLFWNFNVVGKYKEVIRQEVLKRYEDAVITGDDESFYYEIVKKQISQINETGNNSLLFFLMEDHWFVCPHKSLFFYLLEEFKNSKADVLRATHLIEFWERENAYSLIASKLLYKEYLIDHNALKNLLQKHPGAYITSLPGIFKKEFALDLLENNKSILNSKKPNGFELYGKKAEEFLNKRSFITLAPNFHVLREVFRISHDERAIDERKALKIIKIRDCAEPNIGFWRKTIFLLLHPRMFGGKIKRRLLLKKTINFLM